MLKQIYSNSKISVAKRSANTTFNIESVELPSSEVLAKATEDILHLFPFPSTLENEGDIDQEKEAKEHWEMIRKDFPTLSEEEIEANIDLIDEYYSQNLDYMTLQRVANNKKTVTNGLATRNNASNRSKIICTFKKMISIKWGFARVNRALTAAGPIASAAAESYYPSGKSKYYGYSGGGGSNTRGDAYRHILWNALLAHYYSRISSKVKPLQFAKEAANAYERCTKGNQIDSEAMDYHNNAIGRKIWNDNTSYRKFLGWTVGLRRPSVSRLKDLVRHTVDRNSCYIVKEKKSQKFPNNLLTKTQTSAQIKAKIQSTHPNTAVYFEGDIAPTRYTWSSVFSHYEYYDCERDKPNVISSNRCKRAVHTQKRNKIIPCYKL